LVGETFPWTTNSQFLYLTENHNSVLGIREYSKKAGGKFHSISFEEAVNFVEREKTTKTFHPNAPHLFAFPAECNFSGSRFPLDIIERFQQLSPK
jgi:molybdenum cofactor sulfurtransferase